MTIHVVINQLDLVGLSFTHLKEALCQRLALQGHDSSFLKIETGEHTQIHLNEVGNGNIVAEMEKLLNEELDELRHKVGNPIIIPSDNLDDTSTQNEDAPALVLEQMFLAFGFLREGYESWNKMGKVNVVTASLDKDTSIVLCAVNNILNGNFVAAVSFHYQTTFPADWERFLTALAASLD